MTEAEWLTTDDPVGMVEFLRGNPTSEDTVTWWNSRWQVDEPSRGIDRKFRLFACGCCRRIWDTIPEACNRDAVAAVEEFLDGHVSGPALHAALVASSAVEWKEDGSGRRSEPGYWVVKYLGRGFYKLTAVGIDSLNIDDTGDPSRPVHSLLLAAEVPIVEHLRGLGRLPGAGFRFFAVPVKVKGMGTFPVRAFGLVEEPA